MAAIPSVSISAMHALDTLPAAWATSFMPLGDSHTAGFLALGEQPVGVRLSVGANGEGAWRSHIVELCWGQGIQIPTYLWMRGSFQSTDPNLPGSFALAAWARHQAYPGYAFEDIEAAFAAWWAGSPAQSITLLAGTNDWVAWLALHPGDYAGAGAYAAANLTSLLAQIATTAGPSTVVGFITPPTGHTHRLEALASVAPFTAAIAAAALGGQKVYLMYDASTAFAPIGSSAVLDTGLMAVDDVHLNEQGERVLAAGILRGMLACPY